MPSGKKPAADESLRARAEGRAYTADELEDRAKVLEARMAQLRNRYEQFFLGIDRRNPGNDREALHKELDSLRQITTPNTGLKFKLQTLFHRLLTYERMWMRTEKDMEEGRYEKDLFKARRHAQKRGIPIPSAQVGAEPSVDVDLSDPELSPQGPDERRLRAIYDTFIFAKRECNEPTDGLTYEHLSSRLKARIPEIAKESGGKEIDFKVVIKNGKATLRAVTKG